MTQIEAIYRAGVFRPLRDLGLAEDQHVLLSVEPLSPPTAKQWLEEVQQLQRTIIERRGILPDSTSEIAEDRLREL